MGALASASAGHVVVDDESWCLGCGGEGVHCYVRVFCCDRRRLISAMAMGDQNLLHTFSWGRLTSSGGGRAITTNARQAAASKGVSTSVGTALEFYRKRLICSIFVLGLHPVPPC